MSDRIASIEELKKLREASRSQLNLRAGPKENRFTVHMGTCGIAAGARDILAVLAEELSKGKVEHVTLHQSGCIGLCDQEPMLTYSDKTGRDYLYVHLTRDKAREFVASHILADKPIAKYILEGGKA